MNEINKGLLQEYCIYLYIKILKLFNKSNFNNYILILQHS